MREPNPPTLGVPHIDGLLPDDDDGKLNLMPVSLLTAPVVVLVPAWVNGPGPGFARQRLQLFLGATQVYEQVLEAGFGEWLRCAVGAQAFTDGVHALRYEVYVYGRDETETSDALPITVDRVPPALIGQGKLVFPAAVATGGVTDAWLSANADTLTATLPPYTGEQVSDEVVWYWDVGTHSDWEAGRQRVGALSPARTLKITGELIRARGDGPAQAYYALRDRAGNVSALAFPVALSVDAKPVPRVLPAPQVLQATGSGAAQTLKVTGATTGATVQVPTTAVIHPGETAVLHWGEPGEPGYRKIDPAVAPGLNPLTQDDIAAYLTGQAKVTYQVRDAQRQLHDSAALTLAVQVGFALPPLYCVELAGQDSLRLGQLPAAGATLLLRPWAMKRAGQTLKVSVTGLDATTNVRREAVIVDGRAVTGTEMTGDITVMMPKDKLSGFSSAVQVDVQAWVSFDASNQWAKAKAFGKLTPKILP